MRTAPEKEYKDLMETYKCFYPDMKYSLMTPKERPKAFIVIVILKRMIGVGLLVALFNFPEIQIMSQIVSSFVFLTIVWKLKPYETKLKLFFNVSIDLLFMIMFIVSPIFIKTQSTAWGWVVITCMIIIMVVVQGTMLIGLIMKIQGIIKVRRLGKVKQIPIDYKISRRVQRRERIMKATRVLIPNEQYAKDITVDGQS